jgi:hypothetical protein
MSGIPASVPWILAALLAAASIALPRHLPAPPVVEPAPAAAQVETRIVASGYDHNHRSLPFTVYVLSQGLSWKLESATDLEGGQVLLNPELIAAIRRAPDVFCVGTASSEGVTRAEEARAAQRARKLAEWVAAVIPAPERTRILTLNAGQYKGPIETGSAYQRKAIIIATGPHDAEVNLTEGLTSGLERRQEAFPVVYSLLHRYSRSKDWLARSTVATRARAGHARTPRR